MSGTQVVERPLAHPTYRPLRASLLDLMVLVLSVGVVAGVARHVGVLASPKATWYFVPSCLAGLGLMGGSVWLALRLLRQVIQRAAIWRLVPSALLLLYVAAQLMVFQESFHSSDSTDFSPKARFQVELFPLCGLMLLAGVVIGQRPPQARHVRPACMRWAWRLAVLGGIVAAALYCLLFQGFFISYLVLVALQAVNDAMTGGSLGGPSLSQRLDAAAPATMMCFLTWAAAGFWYSRTLRRDRASRGEALGLLAFTTALVATSAWLLAESIPWLQRWLAEGLWSVVGPVETTALLLGFGTLAAGLTAQAMTSGTRTAPVAVPPARSSQPARWLSRAIMTVARTVALGFVFWVTAYTDYGFSGFRIPVWLPESVTDVKDEVAVWFNAHFTGGFEVFQVLAPERVFVLCGTLWVLATMFRQLGDDRLGAFELISAQPGGYGRWLRLSLGLTVLWLAALPTLGVGGLVLYHFGLMHWTG